MQQPNNIHQGHEINLIIDCNLWQQQSFDYDQLVATIVEFVLKKELITDYVELNVRLTDDATIQQLNKQFRHQDKPTNVLSFPCHSEDDPDIFLGEELFQLGDIVLAYETIEREVKEQKKTFKDHFIHLLVHGTLHILGFDHITDEEAEEMETLEIEILKELNIANPYEENTT